jgi:hypothetical protein
VAGTAGATGPTGATGAAGSGSYFSVAAPVTTEGEFDFSQIQYQRSAGADISLSSGSLKINTSGSYQITYSITPENTYSPGGDYCWEDLLVGGTKYPTAATYYKGIPYGAAYKFSTGGASIIVDLNSLSTPMAVTTHEVISGHGCVASGGGWPRFVGMMTIVKVN